MEKDLNDLCMEELDKFRKQYPLADSGDIQTFIIGFTAGYNSQNKQKE